MAIACDAMAARKGRIGSVVAAQAKCTKHAAECHAGQISFRQIMLSPSQVVVEVARSLSLTSNLDQGVGMH